MVSISEKMEQARTKRQKRTAEERVDQSTLDVMSQIGIIVTGKKHALLSQKNITARQWCKQNEITEYIVHKIERGESVALPSLLKVLKALEISISFDSGLTIFISNNIGDNK